MHLFLVAFFKTCSCLFLVRGLVHGVATRSLEERRDALPAEGDFQSGPQHGEFL